jgi:hypothetical protein
VLPFSSHALFFFFFFFRCITDVLLARRVFFHPPSVCVCVLYITARALERVKMSLKIIQTDEIVRLVNVYFETVWDTPIPFQIESFFVFSFFCFFLFPFESYGIATVEWNTTERERERNKKINYLFFTLFVKGKHLLVRGMNSSLLLIEECIKFSEKFVVAGKDHERSPLFVDHEKTALCDCIMYLFLHRGIVVSSALSLSLLSSHTHTVLIARD